MPPLGQHAGPASTTDAKRAVEGCARLQALGALSTVEARVSQAVQAAVDETWGKVGEAKVKHTDGTSWYQAGVTMALWTIRGESWHLAQPRQHDQLRLAARPVFIGLRRQTR